MKSKWLLKRSLWRISNVKLFSESLRAFSFYTILYNIILSWRYQLLQRSSNNSANALIEPLRYVGSMLIWFLLRLMWFMTQCVNVPGIYGKVHLDEDLPDPPPLPKPYLYQYPCDQKRTLYILNETVAAKGVTNHSDYCSRPFYAQRVSVLCYISTR